MRCVGGVKKIIVVLNLITLKNIQEWEVMEKNSTKLKAILCSRDKIKTRSFKIAHPVKK